MANFQSSFLSTVSEKVTWVSISGEFPLNKRMPIFTTSASNPFSCPQMPMQRWATDQCTNNLRQGCNGSCQWCDLPIWMEQTEQCNTMQRKALRNATKKLRKYLVLPGASWFDPVLLAGRVWESYSRSQEIHSWNDLIILILTHRQLIGSSWSKLAHRLLFAEVRLLLLFNHLRILSWRAPSFPVDPASWNPTRTCARCCTCTAWPGHCFKRGKKSSKCDGETNLWMLTLQIFMQKHGAWGVGIALAKYEKDRSSAFRWLWGPSAILLLRNHWPSRAYHKEAYLFCKQTTLKEFPHPNAHPIRYFGTLVHQFPCLASWIHHFWLV